MIRIDIYPHNIIDNRKNGNKKRKRKQKFDISRWRHRCEHNTTKSASCLNLLLLMQIMLVFDG